MIKMYQLYNLFKLLYSLFYRQFIRSSTIEEPFYDNMKRNVLMSIPFLLRIK